jgi:hypothetical protein
VTIKRCIIIPCHQPKFACLQAFLDSIIQQSSASAAAGITLVLVATTPADLDWFKAALDAHPALPQIEFFCAESYLSEHALAQPPLDGYSVINVKKFAALHMSIQRGFAYSLCIDCDVVALSSLDTLFDAAIQNYEKRQYFG